MKHGEEAALLTDVLDRHVRLLVEMIGPSDWTVYRHIEPFLCLIRDEPVLGAFVRDYLRESAEFLESIGERMARVVGTALALFVEHEEVLRVVENEEPLAERPQVALDSVASTLRACDVGGGREVQGALDALAAWMRLAQACPESRPDERLTCAADKCAGLGRLHQRLVCHLENHRACHPGAAWKLLCADVRELASASSRLHGYVRTSEEWLPAPEDLSQPGVVRVQRWIRVLHLALVTSLACGRSRWATVQRFAARCESLDRERIRTSLTGAEGKAEAWLTMELARYLFDAGYNPLVDAAACGLRPDIVDVTTEPAVYVEAKQYQDVDDGVIRKFKEALAQTRNTWQRLGNRWRVPEAFLLVFRRSGRPIVFEHAELRVDEGRLYVVGVDLADADESGSRAGAPVRIDLRALLAQASPSGAEAEY